MIAKITSFLKNNYRTVITLCVLAFIFSISVRTSYMLFHTVIELSCIVVAFAVFIVTWNSRKMIDNNYLSIAGIAYLFIGILDLLHSITFKGMSFIPGPGHYANQFWIATRFMEAFTMILGFWFLRKRTKLNFDASILIYAFFTTLVILSILHWQVFPRCYIDGVGQTQFKIYTEYLIIAMFAFSIYNLYRVRAKFNKTIFQLLTVSLVLSICSEFCFTLYVSNYSTSNEIGHYFKLASYFMLYKAVVETGFSNPAGILFKNLKDDEERYRLQDASKDKFFAIIAHDLKNPFTALMTFSELIYKNADKLGTAKIENLALRMNQASKQSFNLLESLLGWARLQSGVLKPNPTAIPAPVLINETVQLLNALAEAKDITIELEADENHIIYSDREMSQTVIRNLLTNAIKFSHPSSKITVSTRKTNDLIQFEIIDAGIGIEKENIPRLLSLDDKFTVLGTRDEKGSGLGLILCKEFIEINGGEIWLESEYGQGTTFYFTLPISKN